MKKVFILLFVIISLQSVAQKHQLNDGMNFSGEYNGVFSDIINNAGTLQLFLFQSNNGSMEGLVVMKKIQGDSTSIHTGTITIRGEGKYISGNFMPSEFRNDFNPVSSYLEVQAPGGSYQCRWSIFGEINTDTGLSILGKAVPVNSTESNLIEFTVTKKHQSF